MSKAIFRFYEELNDFLPKARKKTDFEEEFSGRRSVKDMIESLGPPHTEVDLILANGNSVDFDYRLQNGDKISVYPVFEALNIENATRLRSIPLRRTSFIADINLGDIVKYMRALGFDVFYKPTLTYREVAKISQKENRIILTKNQKLLKLKEITHGIYVRPGSTEERVKNIVDYLDIAGKAKPFSRCLSCNSPLVPVPKEEIEDRIPPKAKEFCDECSLCRSCDKVFWKGTHWIKMNEVLERILS